jgi:hypothetical protein
MADPLEAARLKLDRAKEHLQAFDNESGDWLEQTDFCRFDFEDDGDQRWYTVDLGVFTPPTRLSAILGDCLQNLRASLDYLAWELVIANRKAPTNKTAFPIYREPPKAVKRGGQFRPNCLTGVDPRAMAEIERLQPYYGGKNPDTDLLWFVNALANTDKHRTINVVIGQVVINEFRIFVDIGGKVVTLPPAWREAGVLHHGAKAAMFFQSALIKRGAVYVKVEGDALGFITLGQALPWGGYPVSREIEWAWRYINDDLFPRFARFF